MSMSLLGSTADSHSLSVGPGPSNPSSPTRQQKLRQPSLSRIPSSSSLLGPAAGLKRRGSKSSISSLYSFQSGALRDRERNQQKQFEPTYRLQPTTQFPTNVVRDIIESTFTEHLSDLQYDPNTCRQMSKTLSEIIKARVKKLGLKRYRFVVLVHLGQLRGQGLRIASRCLWDVEVDSEATWSMKNNSLFAVGTVFGIYYH
ncbi:dynein light chain Tctex-type 5-like [Corticium candelabrum]|uniref:dynein light chain Tctex-type 5-like n=1 Tax=Corticium candelabrum TaxID=121492 RepID=UPI002E25DF1A|nr:dynein light chain Tctex-type 5-like [Corticium candelabrum]